MNRVKIFCWVWFENLVYVCINNSAPRWSQDNPAPLIVRGPHTIPDTIALLHRAQLVTIAEEQKRWMGTWQSNKPGSLPPSWIWPAIWSWSWSISTSSSSSSCRQLHLPKTAPCSSPALCNLDLGPRSVPESWPNRHCHRVDKYPHKLGFVISYKQGAPEKLLCSSVFWQKIALGPPRTPWIVKSNNPLSLVWFKWGLKW